MTRLARAASILVLVVTSACSLAPPGTVGPSVPTPAARSSAPAPTVPVATEARAVPTPRVRAVSTGIATAPPSPASPTAPAARSLRPNRLVSSARPVFASSDVSNPGSVVDGRYCGPSAWRTAAFPTWLAIRLPEGLSRVLFTWNSGYTGSYTVRPDKLSYGVPRGYRLETSLNSRNGSDGDWKKVSQVSDNDRRTRGHLVSLDGALWIRMTVESVVAGTADGSLAIDEITVHDASAGTDDTVAFLGDSITAGGFRRCDSQRPAYDDLVRAAVPGYDPAVLNAGVPGVNAEFGAGVAARWMADNPEYSTWAIGFGTNDAWQSVSAEKFAASLQVIIGAAQSAGRRPVLARIPYARSGPRDEQVRALNAVIDRLTVENGLQPGPDLYAWFQTHPGELGEDGVHPTDAGNVSINRLWFEALRPLYPRKAQVPPATATALRPPATPCVPGGSAGNPLRIDRPSGFLLGLNYPWRRYGNDFGGNAWGSYGVHDAAARAEIEADFARMSGMGMSTVRWFVFADGRAGIRFDADGMPTGLDENVYRDMDAALELARAYGLRLNLVLLDFHWMRDGTVENGVQLGGHAGVIASERGQTMLVQNVFEPLFRRYGASPEILSWEVMNEPEWAISTFGRVDSKVRSPVSLATFRAFTSKVADAVHRLTCSSVTLGSASMQWVREWKNLGLDYYQVHYYDWMAANSATNLFAASANSLGLDRPVLVGEFPASGSRVAGLTDYADIWYRAGYVGAWAWSMRGGDTAGSPDAELATRWSRGLDEGRIPRTTALVPDANGTVRLNAGGGSYIDAQGKLWQADTGYTGGETYYSGAAVEGTTDDPLAGSERFGSFSYRFPVRDGMYRVTLHFAELYWTRTRARVFDVDLEGKPAFRGVDLFAEAGQNRLLSKTVETTVTDGMLDIRFRGKVDNAEVVALEWQPR